MEMMKMKAETEIEGEEGGEEEGERSCIFFMT